MARNKEPECFQLTLCLQRCEFNNTSPGSDRDRPIKELHSYFNRCEVRSGPKFLVRQYLFADNSTFLARQFHYSDRECRSPLYSITASGSVIASGHLVASNGANMMFLPTRKSSWQGYTEEAKRYTTSLTIASTEYVHKLCTVTSTLSFLRRKLSFKGLLRGRLSLRI